jgi:hypothetical protein
MILPRATSLSARSDHQRRRARRGKAAAIRVGAEQRAAAARHRHGEGRVGEGERDQARPRRGGAPAGPCARVVAVGDGNEGHAVLRRAAQRLGLCQGEGRKGEAVAGVDEGGAAMLADHARVGRAVRPALAQEAGILRDARQAMAALALGFGLTSAAAVAAGHGRMSANRLQRASGERGRFGKGMEWHARCSSAEEPPTQAAASVV